MIEAVKEQQEVLRRTQAELDDAERRIKQAMAARDYAAQKLSFLKGELAKHGN
jgi:hypothetical protein